MTRDQKEAAIGKDLEAFRKQYPSVNSGDLQTFILGWNAGFEAKPTPIELLDKDDDKEIEELEDDLWNQITGTPPIKDDSELFTLAELHLQPYSRTPFEKLLVDGEKNIGTLDFRDCADVDIAKKYFSLLSQAKNLHRDLKELLNAIDSCVELTPELLQRCQTTLNNCKPKP